MTGAVRGAPEASPATSIRGLTRGSPPHHRIKRLDSPASGSQGAKGRGVGHRDFRDVSGVVEEDVDPRLVGPARLARPRPGALPPETPGISRRCPAHATEATGATKPTEPSDPNGTHPSYDVPSRTTGSCRTQAVSRASCRRCRTHWWDEAGHSTEPPTAPRPLCPSLAGAILRRRRQRMPLSYAIWTSVVSPATMVAPRGAAYGSGESSGERGTS
jgi:hypothetical protein